MERTDAAEIVRYRAPTPEQIQQHERLAVAAEQFIIAVFDNCPNCADRSAAIRHIREAKMTASAAVALEGKV